MWNFIVKILLFVGGTSRLCEGVCTPVYGGEPCTFLPAEPGHTPPCARPGETFCEHIEQYPMQHIRYLIEKWSYDYSTLFTDETSDKFNSYFSQPDYGYGPIGPNGIPQTSYYPEPIYIPKPNTPPYTLPDNKYIPPPVGPRVNQTDNFAGYPDRRPPVRYPNYNQPSNFLGNYNGFQPAHGHGHHNYFVPSQNPAYFGHHPQAHGQQPVSHYDAQSWWRYTRDNKNVVAQPQGRTKRSLISVKEQQKPVVKVASAKNGTNIEHSRTKRQTAVAGGGGAQTLCQARTQLIMPEAAMNTRGNWMYVVNLQQENQYTQLVNAEVCNPPTQTCSGLCSLPTGYTSRCEQKYVQKRLVALEGTGQNLYTDMFWIPSCCVCMISAG